MRSCGDVLKTGYGGVLTIEAGGPEPGIGCAGRGIISMFEILKKLEVVTEEIDIILYDVLGDVVCGGFAVPIRKSFAREIYIVTSGEFMSLYAANNICKRIARFASRDKGTLAGIIGNGRLNKPWEKELIREFAAKVGSRLMAFFSRDEFFSSPHFQESNWCWAFCAVRCFRSSHGVRFFCKPITLVR